MKCYCQFYNKISKEICNYEVVFIGKKKKSKTFSTIALGILQKKHGISIKLTLKEVIANLNPNKPNVKQFIKKTDCKTKYLSLDNMFAKKKQIEE